MTFQQPEIPAVSNTRTQLLSDNHAQILEWRVDAVKPLERLVGGGIPKGVDEELGVEDVLARCFS